MSGGGGLQPPASRAEEEGAAGAAGAADGGEQHHGEGSARGAPRSAGDILSRAATRSRMYAWRGTSR